MNTHPLVFVLCELVLKLSLPALWQKKEEAMRRRSCQRCTAVVEGGQVQANRAGSQATWSEVAFVSMCEWLDLQFGQEPSEAVDEWQYHCPNKHVWRSLFPVCPVCGHAFEQARLSTAMMVCSRGAG